MKYPWIRNEISTVIWQISQMEQISCHIEWYFRPAECFSLTQKTQKTQNCALADYAKASYSLGSLKGSVVATDANAPRRRACYPARNIPEVHTSDSDVWKFCEIRGICEKHKTAIILRKSAASAWEINTAMLGVLYCKQQQPKHTVLLVTLY